MEQNVIRATEAEFVQVGVYAARDPVTGDFLPSVPLYVPRTPGLTVSEEHIVEGLAKVRWGGRFERLASKPLFIYDGGHNPQGVTAAVNSYLALYGDTKAVVLIGVMADKDYAHEIDTILPIAGSFVTVRPDNPRALPADKLAE